MIHSSELDETMSDELTGATPRVQGMHQGMGSRMSPPALDNIFTVVAPDKTP